MSKTSTLFDLDSYSAAPDHATSNKLLEGDHAVHGWYRFVLSFPPHLVRKYLDEFGLNADHLVLDPFCGTGTTLVEAQQHGIRSIGLEANPFAHFASTVKTTWTVDADQLLQSSQNIVDRSERYLIDSATIAQMRLPDEINSLILKNSISPIPLDKTLRLLDMLEKTADPRLIAHQKLALAKALVYKISNLRFGPEVGIGKIKTDAPVFSHWLAEVQAMSNDLRQLPMSGNAQGHVYLTDARSDDHLIKPASIDAVITSPPYPNEKDYTRTTRLESVLLGFITDKAQLRRFKKTLLRSNTRNVYKGDEDDRWVMQFPTIMQLSRQIEDRRIELGKTSGFERLYGNVVRLYFGGMARHLMNLRPFLKPGARLAYVVGDQASYFQVLIQTGTLLVEIAESLGYQHLRTDLFRTRLSTATREQLREEVVILYWPGSK